MPAGGDDPVLPGRVVIAGAGIAGMALALALARRGIASCIVERRPVLSEAGAGIQIGPNGVRALAHIGALAALLPRAGRPEAIVVREGASGRELGRLPLGSWIEARQGAPYLVAHRRDLQAALLQPLQSEPRVELRMGETVTDWENQPGQVAVRLDSGAVIEGAALIAADGLHSRLRLRLFPGSAPRFGGRTATRAVIPAKAASACLDPTMTGVWLSPDAHVVHYPVRAGSEIAVIVIRTEAWQDAEWSGPVDRRSLEAGLGPFAPELASALGKAVEWRRWALFEADPLARWSQGRVALIGDAAHPVLPFLAQGGCLALEDAVTLAAALAAAPADVPAALVAHTHARAGRAAAVVRASARNGRIYHLGGSQARWRDLALRWLPPGRVMAGYDWIYGWRPPRNPC